MEFTLGLCRFQYPAVHKKPSLCSCLRSLKTSQKRISDILCINSIPLWKLLDCPRNPSPLQRRPGALPQKKPVQLILLQVSVCMFHFSHFYLHNMQTTTTEWYGIYTTEYIIYKLQTKNRYFSDLSNWFSKKITNTIVNILVYKNRRNLRTDHASPLYWLENRSQTTVDKWTWGLRPGIG